ncbi:hypothetical protein [Campylobacter sp.]|uniref:hypothetical protein n=1 Tax=Campylobacter sp. TaxID=205 RepID=UPI002AA66374|nr:hypothetical protein [Campylobacter sp.]
MELVRVSMKALLFVILILIIALAIAVIRFTFKAVFFVFGLLFGSSENSTNYRQNGGNRFDILGRR